MKSGIWAMAAAVMAIGLARGACADDFTLSLTPTFSAEPASASITYQAVFTNNTDDAVDITQEGETVGSIFPYLTSLDNIAPYPTVDAGQTVVFDFVTLSYAGAPDGTYTGLTAAHVIVGRDTEVDTADVPTTIQIGVSAAPEPSTWALMLAGVGAVGASLRTARRRRTGQPA